MASRRNLRSSSKTRNVGASQLSAPLCIDYKPGGSVQRGRIQLLAKSDKLPKISADDLLILRAKQAKLRTTQREMIRKFPPGDRFLEALASTLIFAQYEAGTAVCIKPTGDILSCAHCFGETEDEWRRNRFRWLLYCTGQAVLVECRRWDSRRDLARAQIVAIELCREDVPDAATLLPVFSFVRLSTTDRLRPGASIFCIGQPGRDDLESVDARKTTYNLFELSVGSYRGMVPGVDPHDCSEMGSLKHDAWTYWGHSGAPLLGLDSGELIGLHSSWDDQTAMRHGVPAVAIAGFLGIGTDVIDLTED